jgi:hypothetical protein
VPMRALADKEALAWLVGRGRIETSTAALARDWRWSTSKVKSRLERWSAAGEIEVKPGLGGRTVIAAPQQLPDTALDDAVSTVVSIAAPAPAMLNRPHGNEALDVARVLIGDEGWKRRPCAMNGRLINEHGTILEWSPLPTVPAQLIPLDLGEAEFLAALASLRNDLRELAHDLSSETNIDRRLLARVRRFADCIPPSLPSQDALKLIAGGRR